MSTTNCFNTLFKIDRYDLINISEKSMNKIYLSYTKNKELTFWENKLLDKLFGQIFFII